MLVYVGATPLIGVKKCIFGHLWGVYHSMYLAIFGYFTNLNFPEIAPFGGNPSCEVAIVGTHLVGLPKKSRPPKTNMRPTN